MANYATDSNYRSYNTVPSVNNSMDQWIQYIHVFYSNFCCLVKLSQHLLNEIKRGFRRLNCVVLGHTACMQADGWLRTVYTLY